MDDVIPLIFQQLSDEAEYKASGWPGRDPVKLELRRTFLNCALACRALKEHALDALWRELPSIEGLLKLIPSIQLAGRERRVLLNGPVKPEDVRRFKYYTRRVRILRHDGWNFVNDLLNSDSNLLHLLGTPILPRLRTIQWWAIKSAILPFPLISPTLTSVHVQIDVAYRFDSQDLLEFEEKMLLFLDTLAVVSPSLKNLTISGLQISLPAATIANFGHLAQLCLGSHPSLRKFVLSAARDSTLSTCTSLTSLQFDISDYESVPPRLLHGLRSLTEVALAGSSRHIAAVLGDLQSSPITSLSLHPTYYDERSFLSMFRNINFSYLQELDIIHSVPMTYNIRMMIVTPQPFRANDILSPLLKSKHLVSVRIPKLPFILSLTDGDLWTMARAWPHLQHFAFNFYTGSEDADGVALPDISSLEAFARFCPKLETVAIFVARQVSNPIDPPVLKHGLKKLRLFADPDLSPSSERRVAEWLNSLFPNLENVEVFGDMDKPVGVTVREVLKTLQNARAVST